MINDSLIHILGMIGQLVLMVLGLFFLKDNLSTVNSVAIGGSLLVFFLWSIYLDFFGDDSDDF